MKFLHIGNNICGIPNAIARAQREAGHDSKVLSFERDAQGHVSDILIETDYKIDKLLTLLIRKEKIFIFVGDTPFAGIDILFWKLLGKKVAVHYHGSEVRGKGPRYFHRFADALFVSTPDLLEDVPNATWLPNPIFIEDYKQHYTINTVVCHAPSNRDLKGTVRITEAVKNVQKRMPRVTLDLVEGIPYSEALERYRGATVMIDQIKIGWYGMVALECMAMGVPVMCYIKDELKIYFNGVSPVCFTDESHLEKDLYMVLQNPIYQDTFTLIGKEYVNRVHNPKAIVNKITECIGQ